jgi:hypothetical protein
LWLRLLAIAFLFLFFVLAPYRLWLTKHREVVAKDRDIAALQSQIAAKMASREQVARLWKLREEGVALRNERLTDRSDQPAWIHRFDSWQSRTLDAAGEVSQSLRSDLSTLNETGELPAGINPRSPEHRAASAF